MQQASPYGRMSAGQSDRLELQQLGDARVEQRVGVVGVDHLQVGVGRRGLRAAGSRRRRPAPARRGTRTPPASSRSRMRSHGRTSSRSGGESITMRLPSQAVRRASNCGSRRRPRRGAVRARRCRWRRVPRPGARPRARERMRGSCEAGGHAARNGSRQRKAVTRRGLPGPAIVPRSAYDGPAQCTARLPGLGSVRRRPARPPARPATRRPSPR